MKPLSKVIILGILSAPGLVLGADEKIDVEALKQEVRELRQRTEQLERKLQLLEAATPSQSAPAAVTNVTSTVEAATQPQPSGAETPAPTKTWSPTAPITLGTAQNFINVSFDVLATGGTSTANDIEALEPFGHDPKQRGFTLQNAELTLEGKIDPYFRGQANTVLFLDPNGETHVELEEAYMETMSLPWNLQVKAGQFLTDFGRINPTHPHTWDFVDAPLVLSRFFGEDGLRNPGVRLSWLAPTPFYSELFFTIQNSQGGTAHSFRSLHDDAPFFGRPASNRGFRNIDDLLFVPRYAMSFDLTGTQTLLAGASAAFGPNSSGNDRNTQIYGVDLFWKWKSANQHGGFPFVSWQTEAMMRRFEAGQFNWDLNHNGVADPGEMTNLATGAPALLPGETLKDYGMYSQVAYGFRKGWVAALRGDFVFPDSPGKYETILGPDPARTERWRISPNLTYYPSEFSKLRLQYNFDHRRLIGDDHSVWLQFEFLLGTHAAHKF
jgi:hypothetical protein